MQRAIRHQDFIQGRKVLGIGKQALRQHRSSATSLTWNRIRAFWLTAAVAGVVCIVALHLDAREDGAQQVAPVGLCCGARFVLSLLLPLPVCAQALHNPSE